MDGNLEVGVLEVYQEHPDPLPDRPQDRHHRFHPELRQCHEATEGRQIEGRAFSPKSPPPEEQAHELTQGHKTEVPGAPAKQVEGDGMGPCNPNGAARQSTPRCRRTAKHSDAAQVYLPPAAVREARNLQNFFPLPRRAKDEEVLQMDEEVEAVGRKENLLGEETIRRLGCCCCCW